MKKLISVFVLAMSPVVGFAAGTSVHLDEAPVDLNDIGSLQRGAKYFVNYCLNCHSASYMRYNRMGRDLGINDDLLKENLLFTADKVGATMDVAMSKEDAKRWFGTVPPDLSVVARSRGADWLYTYLRTFYVDETRPFGVNNLVFKDVGMPHVLWKLQGLQKAVFETQTDADGNKHEVFQSFEIVEPGTMTADEYDAVSRDLVNYLVYMGEPAQQARKRLGVWVILFLLVFLVVAYALKKEYWKDVH